jgi:hypothetical protein
MTTEVHDSNQWCGECQGFTHAPWCSFYVEQAAEAVSKAENQSQGDSGAEMGQCCDRCDYSDRQEQELGRLAVTSEGTAQALEEIQAEQSLLTEEEAQLVLGAIPLQALPDQPLSEEDYESLRDSVPEHQTAKIDPEVKQRISTAIRQDQTFASLTTVRAAIFDVIDAGRWEFYEQLSFGITQDRANEQRCDFVDAVSKRILQLQQSPHGMDAGLREGREK